MSAQEDFFDRAYGNTVGWGLHDDAKNPTVESFKFKLSKTDEEKSKEFLNIKDITIGSWWSSADGGKYGYTVLEKNLKTNDLKVLSTIGEIRFIDAFKIQYRYKQVIPNSKI